MEDLLLTSEEIQNITVGFTGKRIEEIPVTALGPVLLKEIAQAQLNKAASLIRRQALIEGITMYAWWKDSVQYVGTTGKTLKEAIAKISEEQK